MEILQLGLLIIILIVLLIPRPYRHLRAKSQLHSYIIDSSVLIDGRIIDIAKTGFLHGELCIPSSVLREIQYLADESDAPKRARARHGLDVVTELKQLEKISVRILQDGLPGDGGVDERLITLCKKNHADLITIDFNLNKVAQAEDIIVLNINELAQNLRTNYLPGEKRHVMLVQKGTDNAQAVGYLEDGTMVVVDNAKQYIGSSVEVEFNRIIQTQAGKMMFAKRIMTTHSKPQDKKNSRPRRKVTPEDRLVNLANK